MMQRSERPFQARGTAENPPNRFVPLHLERDESWNPEDDPLPRTRFFHDHSQTIIATNDSPDISFEASINPYRGCEHGCVYCYARPFHEYLGFSSGLDFETRIMVKADAPRLLRNELSSPRWQPKVLALSGVTDPYQPIERRLQITRGCLEVLAEFRNPVVVVTKNQLVLRDTDCLGELARHQAAAVYVSLTTLDTQLRQVMEPRTSPPAARLATIKALAQAGIPVGVLVSPVIPALNDHELPALITAAAEAGAQSASYLILRLPHSVSLLFEEWLGRHFPDRKDKVLNQLRAMRGGKLYDATFGRRMRGEGIFARQTERLFAVACRKAGLTGQRQELSCAAFRRPGPTQLSLLD